MQTYAPNTMPPSGMLGLCHTMDMSLATPSTEESPDISTQLVTRYMDSTNYTPAEVSALKLLEIAERNIQKKYPNYEPDEVIAQLQLLHFTPLDRGLLLCADLATRKPQAPGSRELAEHCLDYLEKVVSAYRVYEDPNLTEEDLRASLLENCLAQVEEYDAIDSYLQSVLGPFGIRHENLAGRSQRLFARIDKIRKNSQDLIDVISVPKKLEFIVRRQKAALETERRQAEEALAAKARQEAYEAIKKQQGEEKLKVAHERNRNDMGKQLGLIEAALNQLPQIADVIERLKESPLDSTEVVTLYQQVQPYLETINGFRKFSATLDRFAAHASTRRVELIGVGEEADRLSTLHASLTERVKALKDIVEELAPLLKFQKDNPLVAIGSPAIERPMARQALTQWGNYPDVSAVYRDPDYFNAMQRTGFPDARLLLDLPEMLIFAPDHLLMTDREYRDAIVADPTQYVRIRAEAMMDAFDAIEEGSSTALRNEGFIEAYTEAVQKYAANEDSPNLDNLRKRIWIHILSHTQLKDVLFTQLGKFLKLAVDWIDAHTGVIEWNIEGSTHPSVELTKTLLPHIRNYFLTKKTTLAEEGKPLTDFADIGTLTLFRFLPVLNRLYRKQNKLLETQKIYLILGMRPLDPDFPEWSESSHASQGSLLNWAHETPSTPNPQTLSAAHRALSGAQILTTPTGSYILLGDNPAVADLQKYLSSEKPAPYKGRAIQEDIQMSTISITSPVGCRLTPFTSLMDHEKVRAGWYADFIDTLIHLTSTHTNLSHAVANELTQRREGAHTKIWKDLAAAASQNRDPNYQLARTMTHYQM